MKARPSGREDPLARDLSALLIELSIGVHRYAMYPPDHPSLDGIVEQVTAHLTGVLVGRGTLAIGVAHHQLVVEGVTTDPRNALLVDLARRLHEHQLGAISFERGIGPYEVAGLLEALGREPDRDGTPLGLLADDAMPRWPHARLHRVGYEHLRLREGASGSEPGASDRGTRLWLGLAQVSIASEEPLTETPDAGTVARSISRHGRETAYDQAVVGYLSQLTEELRTGSGQGEDGTRERVSRLIRELDESTLSRLMAFGGSAERRHRFVRDANQALGAESVLKLLRASAASSQQTISHSMTRLLTKLAAHAEDGTGAVREHAETALRENVDALIADWALEDPNPDAYTLALDAMARATPSAGGAGTAGAAPAEAERLMEMALEIDGWGPTVERALEHLVARGGSPRLVRMLQDAPAESEVARRAWGRVATLDELRRLVLEPEADGGALRVLATQMGEAAVDPLFDFLCTSEDRGVRRRTFDVLLSLSGDRVVDRALRRLADPAWYVQRNMLALLLHFRPPVDHLDLVPWCEHENPRVRREALALAMTGRASREAAVLMALADEDERVVRVALGEVTRDASEAILRQLFDQVLLDVSRSEELRVAAVRAVAGSRAPSVADALVESVADGRTLLGRPRLAPATPSVVEALWVLASAWPEHEGARAMVDLARRARRPALRAAVARAPAGEPTPVRAERP